MEIAFRRARRSDRPAVLEIVRSVWGGEDYLPHVFNEWVRDERQPLLLAVAGERVIAVGRLGWLTPRDAWLEGLRVASRYRGKGVGRALMVHRVELARQLGARTVAWITSTGNEAQHRSARKLGFTRVDAFRPAHAPGASGERARSASASELPALWRLARAAADRRGYFARRRDHAGLRFTRLTRDDVARAVRARRCLVVGDPGRPRAFAIAGPGGRKDVLAIEYLAGDGRSLGALLRALRATAHRRGAHGVSVHMPMRGLAATFARAGYEPTYPRGVVLYERRLPRGSIRPTVRLR